MPSSAHPSAPHPSSAEPRGTGPSHLKVGAAVGKADHLQVDGVSRSYPDRRVLTDITFTVSAGERACLIGENGTGKSTLLRIIAGMDQDHGGTVRAPGTVGLYHQQPPFDPHHTVAQVLASAVQEQHRLVEQIERLGSDLAERPDSADLAGAYDAALAEAVRTDAWSADRHADRLVQGLGLAHLDRTRTAAELSGGQLSRLSLAWLLLRRPDTLLLDEPTNHLDSAGTALLVDLLTGWTGPVLIASHDRAFLDEVATTLLDLDPAPREHRAVEAALAGDGPTSGHGLTRFTGRYTDYLLERIAARERWERRHRDEQAELRRLRAEVVASHTVGNASRGPRTEARSARKFYADRNAKVVSRRVNDAATALNRLEETQVRRPPEVLRFSGLDAASPGPSASGSAATGPVLTATGVHLDGRLAPTSLAIGARDRLLITGPNGAGKSTLLGILAGRLLPDDGSLASSSSLTVGLLGQDAEDGPEHGAETVAEAYARRVGADRVEKVPLSTFGLIAGRDHTRRVRELSVGQRRRLDLAVLLADPPQVLLLDEPTNHFSLLLATQLEASIPDYPGAVVVASHDRWLQSGWRGPRRELAPWSGQDVGA
ncbi:ABC-F family ATP-binding cassette domain-containing protein [Micrococcus terreus]|uniref:Macrolide transport system ATP-binding/permease protein n=1 Tax=Micrococcus terreus TaxID=574650 RepID=A0A1I7MR96_9MICC|nr:ABC-F family ATP-binding cassette domain-containing protein [Micrococcus terreus]SFV24462.1 macrolide transport system ATP-binding/permease protein [Micrococcus terreus]